MHALSLRFIKYILALLPFTCADYTIDDADYDIVQYSNPSKWTHYGSDAAHNNTISDASCETSDVCSIEIPFHGSGIIIYGNLYGGYTNFTVSIDGEQATAPVFLPDGKVVSNASLYDVESISLAAHNLTISLVNWDGFLTRIQFDYALVNTTAPAQVSSPAGNSSPGSYHSNFSIGAVVGESLAGLAVIAIILAFFYFWRKRRALRLVHAEIDPEPNRMLPDAPPLAITYTPFPPPNAASPLYPNRSSNFTSEQQSDNARIISPVTNSLISPLPPTSTVDSTDLHSSTLSTEKTLDDDVAFIQSPASLQASSASNQLTDEQADFVNSLRTHNIPAPAIARIVQRMMAGQETGELDETSTTIGDYHYDAGHGDTTASESAAPPRYSES